MKKYLHRKVGDRSQLFPVMIQRCQIFHPRCRMDPLRVVTLQVLLIRLSVLDFMAFSPKHLTAPSWRLPGGLSTTTLNFASKRAQHLPHGGCRFPDLLDPGPSNHSHPCSYCWKRDLSHEHEGPKLLLEPGSPVLATVGIVSPLGISNQLEHLPRFLFAQAWMLTFLLGELFLSCATWINNRWRWRSQFYSNDILCSSHSKLFCIVKTLLTRYCCLTSCCKSRKALSPESLNLIKMAIWDSVTLI